MITPRISFRHLLCFCLLSGIIVITSCYAWISLSTRQYLYQQIDNVPYRRVGLVLGTNKYLKNQKSNLYYQYRIEAAAKLYHANKVDYFIVSGDNRANNYNEPQQMRADLIKHGVPASHIQPDYAGLRTLDSVLRIDKVFGHQNYVIISQRFHNQRALFLAHAKGQVPIAFNADHPPPRQMIKVIIRETLARVKAIIDLITNKQARHYGAPIIFPPTATQ